MVLSWSATITMVFILSVDAAKEIGGGNAICEKIWTRRREEIQQKLIFVDILYGLPHAAA